MTSPRGLKRRVEKLKEIGGILEAMKNLAVLETHKLAGVLDNQKLLLADLEQVAQDFLPVYPYLTSTWDGASAAWLLFGSERGFCGDFNESVLRCLDCCLPRAAGHPDYLIPVGRKLCARLAVSGRERELPMRGRERELPMKGPERNLALSVAGQSVPATAADSGDKVGSGAQVYAEVPGAAVAEETAPVLMELIRHIGALQAVHGQVDVFAVYHHADGENPLVMRLLPPFRHLSTPAGNAPGDGGDRSSRAIAGPGKGVGISPPAAEPFLLNVPSQRFYLDLVERYLFVALQEIASTSLMAENHRRIRHLSGAAHRLEDTEAGLLRKYHEERQEAITEEIEIILLEPVEGGER